MPIIRCGIQLEATRAKRVQRPARVKLKTSIPQFFGLIYLVFKMRLACLLAHLTATHHLVRIKPTIFMAFLKACTDFTGADNQNLGPIYLNCGSLVQWKKNKMGAILAKLRFLLW